ncbi:MAG: hypothetical protein WCE51_01265 [Chthoniobacterales bacterium]
MKFSGAFNILRSSSGKTLGGLLLATALGTPLQAGPFEELRSDAQLSQRVDLARLKNGQIICTRGALGAFSRGISLQSCYFIRAPMQKVGDALLHWDPPKHKELEIHSYHEYSLPGTAAVFAKLRLDPGLPEDHWLLKQTDRVIQTGEAGDLHLTNKEAARLAKEKTPANTAWQEILHRRSDALAQGGLAAVPPYGADRSLSPASEFEGLLSLVPQAARHFQPIDAAWPHAAAGRPANELIAYWETPKIRDHHILQLGFFAAQKGPDSWQVVDCVYYPSDTYFMSLNFFQLWPVDGGTLVWHVGLVSAPFRSYLGGIDRYFAGKIMTQATLATIKAFRADLEQKP